MARNKAFEQAPILPFSDFPLGLVVACFHFQLKRVWLAFLLLLYSHCSPAYGFTHSFAFLRYINNPNKIFGLVGTLSTPSSRLTFTFFPPKVVDSQLAIIDVAGLILFHFFTFHSIQTRLAAGSLVEMHYLI